MINNKVTIISLTIIVFAVAVYFMSKSEEKKQSSMFYSFVNPTNIKQITVEKNNKTLNLISRKNRWHITDNNSLEISVESSKILPIFDFINDSTIVQRITKKKPAYSKFDIDGDKASTLILHTEDGNKHVFYVGKQKDQSSQFIRKTDDPYVYLVSKRLSLNMDKSTWFYNKILDYDLKQLDHIAYTCDKKNPLEIYYDNGTDNLLIKDLPEGKQVKDIEKIREAFLKISISKYLPKSEKIETTPVVEHKLYFKNGESIALHFLKSGEDKSTKHFLDIKVTIRDNSNKDLKHIKSVTDKYLFSLSWFDKNNYQRKFNDFFEDIPAKAEKEDD